MKLWEYFYDTNPLEGFTPDAVEDIQGWGSSGEAFDYVLNKVRPTTIIEVGAWKGASAVYMAEKAPQASILCIDTWLGSSELFDGRDPMSRSSLRYQHGWPHLYYTFASNIVRRGLQERVCPMPLPSSVAAQVLHARKFMADVIYIDGSHAYRDVKNDLMDYWPLVRPGGILFGDDYAVFASVRHAVDTFFPAIDRVMGNKYIVEKGHGPS